MATISLPGLSTGIDTNALIAQLIAAEGKTRDMYTARVTALQNKKDTIGTFRSDLSALQSAVKTLSDANSLRAFNITSSDENILTAEANNNAFEGNHSIVVNQLATADRWVHNTGFKYAEDYVGTGNFIYSYAGKEAVVTTTSTTTLEDLAGLINNDADNPGVTASLLYFNDAYHLVLSGNDAGSDYGISVNSSSTQALQSHDAYTVNDANATLSTQITKLDQFGSNPLQAGETIQITGTDHYGRAITPVTLSLTDNTKISHLIDSIQQAFDGNVDVSFENGKILVADKFSGNSQLSLSLAYSNAARPALPAMDVTTTGGAASATLAGFAASTFTRSQVAQDSKIKVDGYPVSGAVSEVQQITHSASTGTFKLSFDGFTTDSIAADASASDIQAALEALPNVAAGDITVTGDSISSDGTLTFTFKNTLGDAGSILVDSSDLSSTLTTTEQTKGVDEWISRSSNTVDNVISGITLHLHDVTTASGEQITLTRNVQAVTSKINAMVNAYNTLASYIKDKTGYNVQTKVAGVLMGDYVVTDLNSQLYTSLITQTKGFIAEIGRAHV
jgi:flagellar hook-associated protein 2